MSPPNPERVFVPAKSTTCPISRPDPEDGWPIDFTSVAGLFLAGKDPHYGNWLYGQPDIDSYLGFPDVQEDVAKRLATEHLASLAADHEVALVLNEAFEVTRLAALGYEAVRSPEINT